MLKKLVAAAAVAGGISLALAGSAAAQPDTEASPDAVWYIHSYHEASYTCESEGMDLLATGVVNAYNCKPDSPYPQKPWTLRVLD